jgi:bifunctional non-homologous end joining protein LigD
MTPPLSAGDLFAIEPMIPKGSPPRSQPGWGYEFKYDGDRCLASRTQLRSRNKQEKTAAYPEITSALHSCGGSFIVDGEICVLNEHGIPDFKMLRSRGRGGPLVTFLVFDVLARGGRDLRQIPLIERKRILERLIPGGHPRLRYVTYIENAGEAVYALAIAAGYEGMVGKDLQSHYIGGPTTRWLKSKPTEIHNGWKRRKRSVIPPDQLLVELRKLGRRRCE